MKRISDNWISEFSTPSRRASFLPESNTPCHERIPRFSSDAPFELSHCPGHERLIDLPRQGPNARGHTARGSRSIPVGEGRAAEIWISGYTLRRTPLTSQPSRLWKSFRTWARLYYSPEAPRPPTKFLQSVQGRSRLVRCQTWIHGSMKRPIDFALVPGIKSPSSGVPSSSCTARYSSSLR